MDQDALSIALALLAILILISGLRRGAFEIQFIRAARATNPIGYWVIALLLVGVIAETAYRAWYVGCVDCL
jgi:hypothetical protein